MGNIKDLIKKKKKDGVRFHVTVDIRKVENFFKKVFRLFKRSSKETKSD